MKNALILMMSLFNPDPDFADPMILKAQDSYFYAYGTGMKVMRSKDLKEWKMLPDPMPVKPTWASRWNKFWAPHVIQHNSKYYLFYSAQPDWSEFENMRLGVAVSDKPQGPFKDIGHHLDTGDAEENIDSMPFKDPVSGKVYLYWGRNGVISVQELDSSLTKFKGTHKELLYSSNREYEQIVEAPFVYYKDGLYHMFYSGDDCCTTPHYAVMSAVSKSPLGPFRKVNKPSLLGNSVYENPGHNAVFQDGEGKDWMVYHAIDPRHPRDVETNKIHRVMRISPLNYRERSLSAKVEESLILKFD